MKQIKYLILHIIILGSFFACSAIFDNPVDPESDRYKGYKTVNSINDIESVETAEFYTGGPELIVSKVEAASQYYWEFSNDKVDFSSAIGFTINNNIFNTNAIDLAKGRWYWRCRAIDSLGNSGKWTAVRSFYLEDNIGISYQIKYYSQSLSSGNIPEDNNYYIEGSSIVVKKSDDMERTRFKFNSWNTSPDGAGTSYQPGETIKVGTENIILYAIWDFIPLKIPTIGLNGEWLFNGNVKDTSSYDKNGVVSGASLVQDRFGNIDSAYLFDGVDDYITVSTNRYKLQEFSISMWFKPKSSNNKSLLEYSSSIANYGYKINGSFSGIDAKIINDTGVGSLVVANNSKLVEDWYHLTFIKDINNNYKIYLNGNLVNESTSTRIDYDSEMKLYFGVNGKTGGYIPEWFSGVIDDIRIYDKDLSEIEILDLYNEVDNKAPKHAYVIFDSNSESYATGSMDNQHFLSGVSSPLEQNKFSRTGYNFKGWSTTKNGSVEFKDLEEFTIGYDDVTLYAVWEIVKTNVFFNKNAVDATGEMEMQTFTYGESQRLTPSSFKRPWYNFEGWSTISNGTVDYNDNSYKSFYSGVDVTLYAIWEAKTTIPRDGLIGEWLFTGNVNDTSGNGNHGISSNTTFDNDNLGNVNSALKLNGANSYVDVPISGFSSYTISLWIKKEADGIIFRGKNNEYASRIELNNNDIGVRFNSSRIYSNEFLLSSEMENYIFVVDSTYNIIKIYNRNGNSESHGIEALVYDTIYRIGGSDFIGKIDCLRVYNRVLTWNEREALANEYEEYR